MTTTDGPIRDAAFLRTYAERILNGTESTWETPNTRATTLKGIADRLQKPVAPPLGRDWQPQPREVQLGVIEFHSERVNPGLIKRFYEVRDDLTAAGCIVDLWLMDIATVLGEFGYDMKVFTKKPKSDPPGAVSADPPQEPQGETT